MEETSALTVKLNDQSEGATDEMQRLRHGGQFHHEIVSPHKEAQRVATQTVKGVMGAQGHLTLQTAKKPLLWATRRTAVRQGIGEITAAPVKSCTDSLPRESIKVVYVISRQTQYIVINGTEAVSPSGPTSQSTETQPWWVNTLHSGSDAKSQQDDQPVCADYAQQKPCSCAEPPPTRHEAGVADKDNTETTSTFTSRKSRSKVAKKKELAKTRRKIKRRRARKREAELISLIEFAPFNDQSDITRKSPETTNRSLFGSKGAKESLETRNKLLGKVALNCQGSEEPEPNSEGSYTDHSVLALKQYSQDIMSQFQDLGDSDEEGNDELDDTVACMMKTEKWKAAHRTLCENLVRIGLSLDDAIDEAHDELIELVCSSIPGKEGTEDGINECAQIRINSYLPYGFYITGYQITRQTTQGIEPRSGTSQTPLTQRAQQVDSSGQSLSKSGQRVQVRQGQGQQVTSSLSTQVSP